MGYEELKINQEEMIEGLLKVLKCKSEEAAPVKTKDGELLPFGQGVHDAFTATLDLARDMGFTVCNCDNYGGHIDFEGTGEDGKEPKIFGIIGHLDVVPAGTGWDFDPYCGEVKDGYILGRGTTDDKGPVISCLYVMKAMKDAGLKPKNTIRLILGLDEETHWKGIEYYFSKVRKPDYGFTPDAEFPVINAEKGLIIFDLSKKFRKTNEKGLMIRSIKGGTAPNAVPAECRAVLYNENEKDGYEDIKAEIERFRIDTGYKVNYRVMGKSIEVTTTGKAAHGAMPYLGLNAISIMMKLLTRLYVKNEGQAEFIDFYENHIGFDLNGKGLKMDLSDEPSGDMIFNVGMIDCDTEQATLKINCRYPVTKTVDEVYAGVPAIIEKYDMGIVKLEEKPPIFLDVDNPMVKTLLAAYQKQSGDYESKPLVIGGGTYAKACENVVAYGALFPGDPDLMHQKNECLSVERFLQFTEIYKEAIYKLANEEYTE
ncbi:MAG: dipeptidase PepV [Clostridia bacterium]|nr:dipeptidase PepV [Clostridia bacterium]